MTVQEHIQTARPEAYKGDGSALYRCPTCRGHKKLEVDQARRRWYCHKCGKGSKLDFKVGRQTSPIRGLEAPVLQPAEPGSMQWGYLSKGRLIPERLIRELRPHSGRDPWLVYIPFYELGSDQPCYFIARSVLEGQGQTYWNPPLGMYPQRKSTVLWGLQRVRKPIPIGIVCEGVFDALWSPNGFAILGKSISDVQIDLLKKVITTEIVVMLDGDADLSAHWLAEKLARRSSRHVSLVELPTGSDPDDLFKAGKTVDVYLEKRRRIV